MLENLQMLAATAAKGSAQSTQGQLMGLVFPILALGAVFYFIVYRPQKKQERQTQQMRSSLAVGDEITTSGGIIGKVVTVKDDTVTLETGADRNKIRIQRWAIHSIDKKGNGTPEAPKEVEAAPKGAFKIKSIKKADENKDK